MGEEDRAEFARSYQNDARFVGEGSDRAGCGVFGEANDVFCEVIHTGPN